GQKLVVVGDSGGTIVSSATAVNAGTTAGIEFNFASGVGDNSGNIARIMGYTEPSGGGDILFQTAPNSAGSYATQMTLLRGGNLGIGTTSPAQLLSVAGSGYLTGGLGVGQTETTAGNITGTGRLSITSTTATSTFSTGGLTVGSSQFVV